MPSLLFAQVPEGFDDLFELERVNARIIINDEASVTLPAMMGLGSVTVIVEDKVALAEFFERQYVNAKLSQQIVSDLVRGVNDSVHCKGRRATCQIAESGWNTVQYVVVREQKTLRVIVPDSGMATVQSQERYIDDKTGENALVMHHRLSADGGSEGSPQLYYQNEAFLGLYGGYIRADLNATTDEDNSEGAYVYLDELAANYLTGEHRIKFGFTSENVPRVWNGTAFLDTEEDLSVLEASAGTTRELKFKNSTQRPRIYFSITQAGRLFVRREDGTPVFEQNVSAGQNFVSYDDLPNGISTLTFEVRAGERVLYEQVHKIYNTTSSQMASGEWDYFFAVGKLYDQEVVSNEFVANQIEDYQYEAFTEARAATQLTQDLKLGFGVFNTAQDYFAKLAFTYQPIADFAWEGLYGHFSDESYYLQSTLTFLGVRFNASRFTDRTDTPQEMTFSNYLFGYGSNSQLTAGYAHPVGAGRAYISYSYFESEGLDSIMLDNDDEILSRYESLTAGYTFSAWQNSTVDVSVTYSDDEDTLGMESDEFAFALSVSLPLSRSAYASYSLNLDENSQSHRIAAGNSYTISPDASVSLEVGSIYDGFDGGDDDLSVDASASGYYGNDYLSGSAFTYGDDDSFNVSANINASSVVTLDGIYQTRKRAESYLLVENVGAGSAASIDKGQSDFLTVANLKGNGDSAGRLLLDSDEVIYPLARYQEYQVTLDEAASDYHNRGESGTAASSYPGTMVRLNVDMREIKSYISIFNDIEGNPVDMVECRGEGCVGVEVLTEGVFKFRVSAGLPFELRTSAQRCLIPSPDTFSTQNLGQNFCMPVFDEEEGGLRLSRGEGGGYFYYVGEFNDTSVIETYEKSLQGEPLTFIRHQVGKRIFLFIETTERLANVHRQTISALGQYALEETLNTPTFVSR
ncbi:CS1-pili formation C-terminal domain-containing protein [Photobacterium minamisatsumaniensis]|uniref:CS1-pili formation C-terminal domain-containing protein n=1 Tax=Photobacterium minamisatsumaniensis TaxID=2910233 RepID=UPI003D134A90